LVSDSLSLSHSNVKIRSIFRALSTQTLTLADLVARGGFNVRLISDNIGITDSSITRIKSLLRTIPSESLTLVTSSVNEVRGKFRAFGETVTLSHTYIKATTRLRPILHLLSFVEDINPIRSKNKTVTAQTLSFTDLENISKLRTRTISDSVTITDTAPVRLRGRITSFVNNLNLLDSLTRRMTRIRTLIENISLSHLTSKIKNSGTPSPTRLYFHQALTTEPGLLPSTNQSAMGVDYNVDPLTTNRSMASTFAQVGNYYLTRFISPPLGQFSIAANTWKYSISAINTGFPNSDKAPTRNNTNPGPININVYVWRPSTGAKVGIIKDGDTSNVIQYNDPSVTQRTAFATFAGAAVPNMDMHDLLVVECWMHIYNGTAGNTIPAFYFDGNIATVTDGAVVSSHAAFIETPESFSFSILRNIIVTFGTPQILTFVGSAPTRLRGLIQTVSGSLTLSSTLSRMTARLRTILPTLSLTDTISRRKPTVIKSLSDSINLTHTTAKFQSLLRSLQDSLLVISTFYQGKTTEHLRTIDHLLRFSDTPLTGIANKFRAFYIRLLRLRGNK